MRALAGLALSVFAAVPAIAQTGTAAPDQELPALAAATGTEPRSASELPPLPPPPPYIDRRLREIPYDPDAVVQLAVAPSRQMTVLLGNGEKILSVAVGDSGAWQVTASRQGDSLFVKPVTAGIETNMTVITDARVYLFDLVSGALSDSVYLVRFAYPDTAVAAVDQRPPEGDQGRYKVHGAKVIRPDVIRDDGAKTYIAWADGKAMPAVFAIAASGEEMLVDGYMREGFYTIDRVYQELIFRFDQKMASATRK